MKQGSNSFHAWRFAIAVATVWSMVVSASAGTPGVTAVASNGVPHSSLAASTFSQDAAASNLKVSVSDIAMSTSLSRKGIVASATVTILNSDGTPVGGALVTGSWSGLTTANASALTNRQGRATFHSSRVTSAGTFDFDLGSVSAAGASYDPAHNLKSHDSIAAPPMPESLSLNDE